jgi:hypothetical protein
LPNWFPIEAKANNGLTATWKRRSKKEKEQPPSVGKDLKEKEEIKTKTSPQVVCCISSSSSKSRVEFG